MTQRNHSMPPTIEVGVCGRAGHCTSIPSLVYTVGEDEGGWWHSLTIPWAASMGRTEWADRIGGLGTLVGGAALAGLPAGVPTGDSDSASQHPGNNCLMNAPIRHSLLLLGIRQALPNALVPLCCRADRVAGPGRISTAEAGSRILVISMPGDLSPTMLPVRFVLPSA